MHCEPHYIAFGTQVALKNSRDNKFLSTAQSDGKVTAEGLHPTVAYSGSAHSQEFTVLHPHNCEYKGPLTFGSQVLFVTHNGNYLAYDATEEVTALQLNQEQLHK